MSNDSWQKKSRREFVKEKEIIVLIGPEGGFSKSEFEKMRALKNVYSLSLGSRILRADTAIISALTLVQEFLGDF
jgi:16S rRNA (uracil1498-N3)-methyltransferase